MNKMTNSFILILIILATFAELKAMNVTSFEPHKLTVLEDGPAAFQARLKLIRKAKKFINMEYYILQRDISSQILIEELIKKSKKGVKVRILLDNYPLKFTNFYAAYFKKYKIELKYYNTNTLVKTKIYNYRNHRKVLSIDGLEAIIGGRNIGKEYFELSNKFNFYDRDLLVQGSIVRYIDQSFNFFWEHKLSVKPVKIKIPLRRTRKYTDTDDNIHFKRSLAKAKNFFNFQANRKLIDKTKIKLRKIGNKQFNSYQTFICNKTQFVTDGPGRKKSASILGPFLVTELKNANTHILMETPYFITLNSDKKLFSTILKKNVDVRLLTNSLRATDAIHVNTVFDARIGYYIKKGLKAYAFTGQSLEKKNLLYTNSDKKPIFGIHSKTYIIDEKKSMVGTLNFDPRSKNLNAELAIICHENKELAALLTKNIEKRMKKSVEIDRHKEYLKKLAPELRASFLKKFLTGLVYLPSLVFDELL